MTTLRMIASNPRGELTLLFLAACAVVVVLILSIAAGGATWLSSGHLRLVVLSAIAAGCAIAGVVLLGVPQIVFGAGSRDAAEIARLRRAVAAAEAVMHADAQVIVLWEHDAPVRVLMNGLGDARGIPTEHDAVARFGKWLDPQSALELKAALDLLFAEGRSFNLMVRTNAGSHLDADGRAAGGRAMLRFRDVVGYKKDIERILERDRQLQTDKDRLTAALDALPMPVWLTEPGGKVAWANAAYSRAVGAETRDEVRGHSAELIEAPQRRKIETIIAEGRTFRERLPLVVGGEMKPHDVAVVPVGNAAAGYALDAAAVASVREEIARQTAAFDRTLHRVSTGVAIYSRDGHLTFFNETFRTIWQLDSDWLAAKPGIEETLDRLRGLSRLPVMQNYREWKAKVLNGHRDGGTFEDWWHLLDGRTIHVTSERRPDGGVTYLFDDVTQRLALESRFNAMIDVQSETLDSLKEGVAVFTPDGRLQLFNKAFARIWRLSRQMLKEGPRVDEVTRQCQVLYDDGTLWQQMNRSVVSISDRRATLSGELSRPDGSVLEYAVAPLPDGATLITFADVTDVRNAAQALIERNEALVQADRLKSEFIRHVSYELRTPLTNILGYTEFMTQSPYVGPLNDKQREYLGDIEGSSKTLLAIIDDILDLATIDAGGLELKVAPIAVRPVIDAALMAVRERANLARIAFDIRIEPGIDTFVADATRVRQVLYNLLSNAIGFSKHGDAIAIDVWRERGMIAFAVEDHGIGVPREQQARVFDRFVSRSHGSRHRGAGLGLSIVKSLVELHGGNVTFVSEPGQGTRVTVRLPEAGIAAPRAEAAA